MTNTSPPIDYNAVSQIYDDVRQADDELVTRLVSEAKLDASSVVLDIGCGTGNYADLLQRLTGARVSAIDPAKGMLTRARLKNTAINFKQADAEHVPFDDATFDFVYMTDVIHHVLHVDAMFAEIQRVLKPQGKVCIVTQSYNQIERRPIVNFFPSTAIVDKARYPDIHQIVEEGERAGLCFLKTREMFAGDAITLDNDFLELVKDKGYSMLYLIPDEEYISGLNRLEELLHEGAIVARKAGESMVWFRKRIKAL